jgi:hypothetical protein
MLRKLKAGMILSAALMAAPFGLASGIEQQVQRELGVLPH